LRKRNFRADQYWLCFRTLRLSQHQSGVATVLLPSKTGRKSQLARDHLLVRFASNRLLKKDVERATQRSGTGASFLIKLVGRARCALWEVPAWPHRKTSGRSARSLEHNRQPARDLQRPAGRRCVGLTLLTRRKGPNFCRSDRPATPSNEMSVAPAPGRVIGYSKPYAA
jgi:hypothetical protein